tara:strand:- start:3457 stop:4359 length:903 start_codon:yes stop_codon:yes gene_type:complete
MLDGYNFLVCGSGPITISHLKALQTIKRTKVKKIFSNNRQKVNSLSSNFNLEILKNLNLENIKDCNACLITNSSEKHFEIIKKLSAVIKFFIVEKPLVENLNEIKKLSDIVEQKNLRIFEVSQFLFFDKIYKLKSSKKVKIFVRKKRIYEDYLNYKKNKTKDKSIIFRQLPHWFDVAKKITEEELELNQTKFRINRENLSYLHLNFLGANSEVIIEIDLDCEKNYSTQIIADKRKILVEENILDIISRKLNLSNRLNFTEKNLRNMYNSYLFEVNNKRHMNNFDFKKFQIFDELFKITTK